MSIFERITNWVKPSNLSSFQGGVNIVEGAVLLLTPYRIIEGLRIPVLGVDKPQLESLYKIIGVYLVSLGHYHITAGNANNENFASNSVMNRIVIFSGIGLLRYLNNAPSEMLYMAFVDVVLALITYMSLESFSKDKGRRRD
ncbi:10977_t:CDS:2 [Ambispora gerdemannii]|uniref:10977_t:CDS:1 n=1 Tax=Ambispora gerdemannii TaxID=144530 RepID=A0A9N8VJZ8_9GLOM|nr:10977_t:CDS:2 [Ambispora gerdemannii]